MSVISGIAGASATRKAADAQVDAAREAAAVQKEMFDISRADLTPWREGGKFALSKLIGTPVYSKPATAKGKQAGAGAAPTGQPQFASVNGGTHYLVPDVYLGAAAKNFPGADTSFGGDGLPGQSQFGDIPAGYRLVPKQNMNVLQNQNLLGPGFTPPSGVPQGQPETAGQGEIIGYKGGLLNEGPGEFEDSPDYQVRLKRGLNALVTKGAAIGRTGGGLEKDIIDYAQDSATMSYDNWLNNYYKKLNPWFSIAGLGQVATSQGGGQALALGGQLGQNALAAGNARASGYINQANSLYGASNSIVSALPHLKGLWSGGSTGGGVSGSYMNSALTYGGGSTGDWYS